MPTHAEIVTSVICGIVIILFFLIYCLSIILPQMVELKKVDPNENFKSQVNIRCVVMHFITMVLGISLGISVLLFNYDEKFEKKIWVALDLFVLSWAIYMAIFFRSKQFEIIKNFKYAFPRIYSEDQFNALWKELSKINPCLTLSINSVDDTQGCQSKEFKLLSSSSTNVNDNPKKNQIK